MSKFGELINANVPILINFYTKWDEKSNQMHPVIKDVAAAMGDNAKVLRIDVDLNPELVSALRIINLPTFIIYKNGEMIWRQSGELDANTFINLLQQ